MPSRPITPSRPAAASARLSTAARRGRGRVLVAVLVVAAALTPVAALQESAHAQTQPADYPFRNPHLSMDRRIDDLLNRLTLDEKISLLHQSQAPIPRLGIPYFKAGTEALHGVAWSNDLNNNWNVVTAKGTVFPQAVGMASTWDPALIRKVGSATGDEARGYNAQNPVVWGLNLWAPVTNLLRDPRWGRNEEGYSEDPLLTSAIATAYGRGLEGDDPTYLKTAPTLKHYLAYNNETKRDTTSSNVPPRVLNEYDRQAFEPTLRADAATGVMSSYNLVNGRPDTVNPDLAQLERSWSKHPLFNVTDAFAPGNLTGSEQYYATQPEADAAIIKAGLNSFTMDGSDNQPMIRDIKSALAQGLLSEQDITRADRPVLSLRLRLGQFDPDGGPYAHVSPSVIDSPAHRQLARRTADEASVLLKNSGGTLPLATRAARIAVVGPLEDTLYSDWYGGELPYRVTPLQGIRERAGAGSSVVGSEGSDRIALQNAATGKYLAATGTTSADVVTAGAPSASSAAQFDVVDWGQNIVTLRNVANGKYLGYNGGPLVTRDDQPNGWYVQQQFSLEPSSDGSVLLRYAGYDTQESWWGGGTYVTVGADGQIGLGSAQAATHFRKQVLRSGIASAVAAAKRADVVVMTVGSMPFINGREAHDRTTMALSAGQEALVRAVHAANPKTVVVLQTSYPDTINWEQEHVPAILWTTHAGAETGHAIADVLFGDYNPSGRLTQTWYRSDTDLPPDLNNYDIISSDQTYLYYQGAPLYPFGYGLSYTKFRYSDLRSSRVVPASGRLQASVRVTNTGRRSGTEVVQLYTHQRTSRDKEPVRQLRGFQRVTLAPHESTTVRFSLPASELRHWDVTRSRWVVESGKYDVLVGASSADIRQRAQAFVRGATIPPRNLHAVTRAENFDGYSGVRLVDETKTAGTALGSAAAGNWAKYADARLDRSRTFTARAAQAAAGNGTIQIRLDGPDGRLVGTVAAPSTGDVYRYETVTAALSHLPAGRGTHDVYLVLSAGLRVSTFSLN